MIHAYFGMAPTLTYIPLRMNGKMTQAKIANYVAGIEAAAEIKFDAIYTSGVDAEMHYKDFNDLAFSKKVAAANNGEVNFADFAAAFFGASGLFAGAPYKTSEDAHPFLFGVIDHNSAHHVSWLLAHRAFLRRATKSKKVVFNFDAHYDYGAGGQEKIHCSTWGVKLFESCRTTATDKSADAYAVIGLNPSSRTASTSGNFSTAVFTRAGQDKAARHLTSGTDTSSGTDVSALLAAIETSAGVSGEKYSAYITYDRDLTKVSCTPYKDGQHDPAHARAATLGLIAALKTRECEVVGFDVCGLPNTDGDTTVASKGKDDGVAEMIADIKAFAAACAAL